MNKALREAPGVALRCLLDGQIWKALLGALLSWAVLGRVIGAIVLLIVGWFVSNLFPWILRDLLRYVLDFILTLWLLPPAVRRACAIIVPRALGTDPDTPDLPDVSAYRGWWLPFLLATSVLPDFVNRFVEPLDLVNTRVLGLAVFAVQVLAARGPVVRGVLAPVLPRADIDAALAVRRGLWLLVTLGYMVVGAVVFTLFTAISGGGGDVVLRGLVAFETRHLLSFVVLRGAIALGTLFAVEILCTAALARIAIGIAAPDGIDDGAVPTTTAAQVPTRRAAVSTPTRRVAATPKPIPWRRTLFVAVVVVLAGGYALRAQLAYRLLGDEDFRHHVTKYRDWSEPEARQIARTQLACMGNAGKLRLLAWAGVRGDRGIEDKALGCAAYHGHLDAVKVLVNGGDDIDRPVVPEDAVREAMLQTPLQEAVRTPAGLPVADWLLAHHAQPRAPGAGADLVQTAAAGNCLPCVEWLHQRGFAMDGRVPATPLTLWLDKLHYHDVDEVGDVPRLIALGMSPSAVGDDGRSPLHAAAAAANPSVVELLLAQGADPVLADVDGATPLLYALTSLRVYGGDDPAVALERKTRRLAVVTRLMALTPSLDAKSIERATPHPILDTNAYLEHSVSFGQSAGFEPALRVAAAQQGKTIHYEDADFLAKVPQEEAFATLAAMDEAQVATVLRPSAWLTGYAARTGWWPQLARAMRVWPRPVGQTHVWPACDVLKAAIAGTHDNSPGAVDSWAVVDAWLEAGMKPVDCGTRSAQETATLERRSRAQLADWQARTVGIDAATRP